MPRIWLAWEEDCVRGMRCLRVTDKSPSVKMLSVPGRKRQGDEKVKVRGNGGRDGKVYPSSSEPTCLLGGKFTRGSQQIQKLLANSIRRREEHCPVGCDEDSSAKNSRVTVWPRISKSKCERSQLFGRYLNRIN